MGLRPRVPPLVPGPNRILVLNPSPFAFVEPPDLGMGCVSTRRHRSVINGGGGVCVNGLCACEGAPLAPPRFFLWMANVCPCK